MSKVIVVWDDGQVIIVDGDVFDMWWSMVGCIGQPDLICRMFCLL